MVKNKTGGTGTKSLARKNENASSRNFRLRVAEEEGEQYAIVRKIYGGSRSEVFCQDGKSRQGIIRGKFSGRNKRNNIILAGTIVLVGLRDWATGKEGKMEECDLLEVYSALEVDQLKQRPNFPTDFFDTSMRDMFGDSKAAAKTDEFMFTTVDEPDFSMTESSDIITMPTGEEISLDDI
jgi:initiation factor 1A